jgi:CDP-2,3-bis-(O-geranylgeranyl)-sn-glycerol synthase
VISEVAWAVVTALWVVLPAYVPNSVALLVGGGPPIDGGRTWRGNRLLGDGKTWRGFAGGALAGILLAFGLNAVRPALTMTLPAFPPSVAIAVPVGAMLGDGAGSFVKRRTGRDRGAPFPLVDQFGFLVGALVSALVVEPAWTVATFTAPVLGAVVVLTPLLHRGTNRAAYALGLKDEPW